MAGDRYPCRQLRDRAEKAEARVKELEAHLHRIEDWSIANPYDMAGNVPLVETLPPSVGGAIVEAHPGVREGTRGSEPAEAPQAANEALAARATGAAPGPGTGGTFPRDEERHRPYQRERAEAAKEPVVWADEASPFTGAQVQDLLRENETLRRVEKAARMRFEVWSQDTYEELESALSAYDAHVASVTGGAE